jgi:hypothetical protein
MVMIGMPNIEKGRRCLDSRSSFALYLAAAKRDKSHSGSVFEFATTFSFFLQYRSTAVLEE